mgnify:CR=1 FL=1
MRKTITICQNFLSLSICYNGYMVKNNNMKNPEYYSTAESLKGKKLTTSLQFTPNKNIGTCYWAIQNVPQCLQYHNKCQINKQMRFFLKKMKKKLKQIFGYIFFFFKVLKVWLLVEKTSGFQTVWILKTFRTFGPHNMSDRVLI